eukprot:scaffold140415_cov32-Tisochrysis_lutea.AAC.2
MPRGARASTVVGKIWARSCTVCEQSGLHLDQLERPPFDPRCRPDMRPKNGRSCMSSRMIYVRLSLCYGRSWMWLCDRRSLRFACLHAQLLRRLALPYLRPPFYFNVNVHQGGKLARWQNPFSVTTISNHRFVRQCIVWNLLCEHEARSA